MIEDNEVHMTDAEVVERLSGALADRLPGRAAHRRFSPPMAYGRHHGVVPTTARRAAVLALLYPHRDQLFIALTRRAQQLKRHGGQIALPGGMLEAGETELEAACRETDEELGVRVEPDAVLGALTPIYVFASNFHVRPLVAALSYGPAFSPNWEVDELIPVPVSALLRAENWGRHTRTLAGRPIRVPHIHWRGHNIWGATAMIIGELISVLEG